MKDKIIEITEAINNNKKLFYADMEIKDILMGSFDLEKKKVNITLMDYPGKLRVSIHYITVEE